MCRYGDWQDVEVTVPADLSHTGKARRKVAKIDRCIAPIIRAIDVAGIVMRGSCCGHGERPGEIMLDDGRCLVIRNG